MDIKDNLIVILDEKYSSPIDLFNKVIENPEISCLVKDSFLDEIIKREEDYPTGISGPYVNFAIPHTDPDNLENPFVAVIKPEFPVQFDAMGMEEGKVLAEIIVMLGVNKNGQQIDLLQKLMEFFLNEEDVNTIMRSNNKEFINKKIKNLLFN